MLYGRQKPSGPGFRVVFSDALDGSIEVMNHYPFGLKHLFIGGYAVMHRFFIMSYSLT